MKTKVVKISENSIDSNVIDQAGKILRAGELVAFPTETVYGLGADALKAKAAEKIYRAKGRPSDNPLIVHIYCMQQLEKITDRVPEKAKLLADAFWPGPLTMVFQKNGLVPYETTGGMDTVAVRMPKNKIALALIKAGGGYIAAPSANTSGRPSPTLAVHVYEDMKNKIPLILDGGEVKVGIESTIVDFTESVPMILRPGCITLEMVKSVVGEAILDPGMAKAGQNSRPKAPGMKYRHYAPKAKLILVEGEIEKTVAKINELTEKSIEAGKKVGIIGTRESINHYEHGLVLSIGERQDEDTIAHNLYKILRQFDASDVDIIYSESFTVMSMGEAIMNRMLKAAGHQVIIAK